MSEKLDSQTLENFEELRLPGSSPPPLPPSYNGWLKKVAEFFQFAENKTDFKTEILAGITTFMTVGYMLIVIPATLSNAIFLQTPEDLRSQLVVSTAIVSALGSTFMALFANYPFSLAPGIGTTAFFTYSVVIGLGIEWRVALSCVFAEGIVFIILTILDLRRLIIRAIPSGLKTATSAGIGLFIAYIGLAGNVEKGGAGLIVASEVTKTAFGQLTQPNTLLALLGILITTGFVVRGVKGALLIGLLATALLAWTLQVVPWPTQLIAIPEFPRDILGQPLVGLTKLNGSNILDWLAILLVFLFVDLFDTAGTLTGVGMRAGYIGEDGELPKVNRAMMADATATTIAPWFGTASVIPSVESVAGVAEGGRTGVTSLTVAVLFLIALFFTPILKAIPAFATTPVLVIVGAMMLSQLKDLRWGDMAEVIPAFLTLFMIPLTYSIAEGLSMGFISYPIAKSFQGKGHEVSKGTWVIAGLFILRLIFMAIRFRK